MTIDWLVGGANVSLSSSSLYSAMRARLRPPVRLLVSTPASEAAPSSPPRLAVDLAALSPLLAELPAPFSPGVPLSWSCCLESFLGCCECGGQECENRHWGPLQCGLSGEGEWEDE